MSRDPATYLRYRHWRVVYRHVDGPVVLPEGYPEERALPVARS